MPQKTINLNQVNSGTTIAAISDGSLGPFTHRNKFINGNFDIWQRGTSQTTNGHGSVDRWAVHSNGSTKTFSRQAFALGQTDVPGEPTYFSRTVVTSVAAVGNYTFFQQLIESVRTFAGKPVTVSFWAKADAAKNVAIEVVQSFGTGGAPSAGVTGTGSQLIPLTTTWQKFTKTITVPSITGKVIGTDNNDWVGLYFWLEAGSDFNVRTASLGQQSGTFDIAQVQIEEGSVATPFEQRPIAYELNLCNRYCFVLESGPTEALELATLGCISTTRVFGGLPLPMMRVAPAVTLSAVGDYGARNNAGTGLVATAVVITGVSNTTARVDITVASGLTGGDASTVYMLNGNKKTIFSAEL